MNTTTADAAFAGSRTRGFSFHLGMTLVMAAFVFAGFGMTYWFPMATGTLRPAPPVVHVHGWVYSAWMVLLVTQAALVNARNIALHRSLGTFGIALATAVLFMGLTITLLGLRGGMSRATQSPDFFDAMYLSYMAILGFAILFTLAMRQTQRPEAHRQLMLFAVLPLLPPGINRFYMVPFHLPTIPVLPLYLTLDSMALALLVHEWRRNRRISGLSMVGAGWCGTDSLHDRRLFPADERHSSRRTVATGRRAAWTPGGDAPSMDCKENADG